MQYKKITQNLSEARTVHILGKDEYQVQSVLTYAKTGTEPLTTKMGRNGNLNKRNTRK
ncbi:hypothetical protein [Listeria newyorkensis]|uniref:Uncharacterized protein n=1 Tax=Listeria newyorkensis TaxID=1497681 RepID=A0A841YTH0_9LIST|nr:hypothetical protein [Listeria newyorkensis]MBC1456558.1 hypothetical protein [Listeria newyorkensis]